MNDDANFKMVHMIFRTDHIFVSMFEPKESETMATSLVQLINWNHRKVSGFRLNSYT